MHIRPPVPSPRIQPSAAGLTSLSLSYRISSNRCRASNKRLPSSKRSTSKWTLIRVVTKSYLQLNRNAYETRMQNNKPLKILLICKFFHCNWIIDSENLCSYLFRKKNDKALTFNIVHFPIFEISASI